MVDGSEPDSRYPDSSDLNLAGEEASRRKVRQLCCEQDDHSKDRLDLALKRMRM